MISLILDTMPLLMQLKLVLDFLLLLVSQIKAVVISNPKVSPLRGNERGSSWRGRDNASYRDKTVRF